MTTVTLAIFGQIYGFSQKSRQSPTKRTEKIKVQLFGFQSCPK